MTEENIYSAPKADLATDDSNSLGYKYFPTSRLKLISLFIATFGTYIIYWFYKNWKLQQVRTKEKINPALRALFYIFFTHSLFRRIEQTSNEQGISKLWSANQMATLFIILVIISNVLENITGKSGMVGIIDFVSVGFLFLLAYPLYMVQGIVNQINNDPEGLSNSTFSIYNIIFIVLGGSVWFLVLAGLFQLESEFLNGIFGQL